MNNGVCMADTAPAPKRIEEKYAEDLSATRYAGKKVYELVLSIGGTIAGGVIGHYLGKALGRGTRQLEAGGNISIASIIGGFAGFIGSGLVLGYEHWKKEESQKLAVAEINRDIANKIGIEPTDKELVRENQQLRAMVEKKFTENETIAARRGSDVRKDILDKGPQSATERLAEEAQGASAEVARG